MGNGLTQTTKMTTKVAQREIDGAREMLLPKEIPSYISSQGTAPLLCCFFYYHLMGVARLLHPVLPPNQMRCFQGAKSERRPATRPHMAPCVWLFWIYFPIEMQVGASFEGRVLVSLPREGRAGQENELLPLFSQPRRQPECRRCRRGCWATVRQSAASILPPATSSSSSSLVLFLLLFLILLLRGVRVPGEALLIERDHHLGALDVGLLGWDQVGLV